MHRLPELRRPRLHQRPPSVRALDRKSLNDGYGVCELESSRTSNRIVAARSPLARSIGGWSGGEDVSVEAYNPASRRGHLKEDDADEGIGLFQVEAMGWRLSPGWDPDSPQKSLRTASARSSPKHELTLPRLSDGNRTSDQRLGVSPAGGATRRGPPDPCVEHLILLVSHHSPFVTDRD